MGIVQSEATSLHGAGGYIYCSFNNGAYLPGVKANTWQLSSKFHSVFTLELR